MITTEQEQEIIKTLSDLTPLDYSRVISEVSNNRRKWHSPQVASIANFSKKKGTRKKV